MKEQPPNLEVSSLAEKPLDELIELEKIICFSELKENSVVVFKIKEVSNGLLKVLTELQKRYGKELRSKNVTLMILGADDKIEEIPEKDMNRAGWIKKDGNRIITLM